MSEASSKWVLHRTWSMGDIVPSLAPLFWILTMLIRLEKRITDMVPAMVFTVAGPFPIFIWSSVLITRSLNGPIFTNKRNAIAPSTKSTKNNNWIILFAPHKITDTHFNYNYQNPFFFQEKTNESYPHKHTLILSTSKVSKLLVKINRRKQTLLTRTHTHLSFLVKLENEQNSRWICNKKLIKLKK